MFIYVFLKRMFFLCLGGSVCSWIAWLFVVLNINPFESGKMGILFFFSTLSMATISTYILVLFLFTVGIRKKKESFFEFLKKNILHASITLLVGVAMLWLFHFKLLVWWNASLLALLLVLLQMCLSINKKYAK